MSTTDQNLKVGDKLINRKIYITDKDSSYYGEWGIIKVFDGEYYHVAIANGTDSLPIFNRDQFKVPRNKSK